MDRFLIGEWEHLCYGVKNLISPQKSLESAPSTDTASARPPDQKYSSRRLHFAPPIPPSGADSSEWSNVFIPEGRGDGSSSLASLYQSQNSLYQSRDFRHPDYISLQNIDTWAAKLAAMRSKEENGHQNQNLLNENSEALDTYQPRHDVGQQGAVDHSSAAEYLQEIGGSALKHWVGEKPSEIRSTINSDSEREQLSSLNPDQGSLPPITHACNCDEAHRMARRLTAAELCMLTLSSAGDVLHDLHEAYMRNGALDSDSLLRRRSRTQTRLVVGAAPCAFARERHNGKHALHSEKLSTIHNTHGLGRRPGALGPFLVLRLSLHGSRPFLFPPRTRIIGCDLRPDSRPARSRHSHPLASSFASPPRQARSSRTGPGGRRAEDRGAAGEAEAAGRRRGGANGHGAGHAAKHRRHRDRVARCATAPAPDRAEIGKPRRWVLCPAAVRLCTGTHTHRARVNRAVVNSCDVRAASRQSSSSRSVVPWRGPIEMGGKGTVL
jgi:hypothetical protein